MIRLLMLEFDPRLIASVRRALARDRVEVVGVDRLERAQHECETGHYQLALLDGDLLDPGDLVGFGRLPLIVMTSLLARDGAAPTFAPRRAFRLLHKPFTSAQLRAALHESVGVVRLEALTLVDLLRRAHSDRRSVALRVGAGEVFVEDGELVHARFAEHDGESALSRMLADATNAPRPIAQRPVERTIHRPFQPLMLDILRRLEEGERALDDTGEPSYELSQSLPRSRS